MNKTKLDEVCIRSQSELIGGGREMNEDNNGGLMEKSQ